MNDKTEIQIRRSKRRFAMIPTAILENSLLSWKAKGLISYLLSRPDGWKIRVSDLINRSTDGRDAVKTALKELRMIGHAEIVHNRNELGHIIGSNYLIHEDQIKTSIPTDKRIFRRTDKPSDGKAVGIIKNHYNNKDYNNKEKKKVVTTNASLFVAPADLVLLKFLDSNSFLLRLPGQPSKKVLSRWLEIYEEQYLQEQFLKIESYYQKEKNSAKKEKIKSISRTANEWLKKEWISDEGERKVLKVFRQWHEKNFSLPVQFDFYHSSSDRIQLALYTDGMSLSAKNPENCLQYMLNNLPTFWKGKKLSSILKNYINISTEIETKGSRTAPISFQSKQSATVENMSWIQNSVN